MPGTVLRQNERADEALARIIRDELRVNPATIRYPKFKSMHEFRKGSGQHECVRGHEIGLLYKTRVPSGYEIKGGKFFSLEDMTEGWPDPYKLEMVSFHLSMATSAIGQ